jgi:serine/threonine-protein kinase
LAKATGRVEPGREADERMLVPLSASGSAETLPGSALGTPAYMSPEQAEGDFEHLGPRSDIYSLGATLYNLLTGNPPFDGDVADVIRRVQRGAFRRPRQVAPAIDPALEAVCLKAMAVKPVERYATPKALAEDVERWMADEPIGAYREPLSRRARRWEKRNRTAVVSCVWLVLASLVGLSLGVVLLRAKQRETETARAEAVENYRSAVLARQEADSARGEAETNLDRAMDAVETMLVRVGRERLANLPHFEPVRRQLLEDALGFYQDFLARAATSPQAMLQGARAYRFAAEIHRAVGQRDKAHQELGKALEVLNRIPDGPGRALEQAAAHAMAAAVEFEEGRVPRAIEEYRRGLALLAGYDEPALEPRVRRAFLILEAETQSSLASSLSNGFRFNEAQESLRRAAVALERLIANEPEAEEHRYRLSAINHNEGMLHFRRADFAAAAVRFRDAIRVQDSLLQAAPDRVLYRRDLGNSNMHLGPVMARLGRFAEAVEVGRRAVSVYDRLAAEYPTVWEYRFQAAATHHNLAIIFGRKGELAQAQAEYRESIEALEVLNRREPDNAHYLRDLAGSHMSLGALLAGARRFDDSSKEMSEACDLLARAVRLRPDNADVAFQAAAAQHNRAEMLVAAGRLDEAVAGFQQSQDRLEGLISRSPGSPRHLRDLASSTLSKGHCLLARGERAKGEAELTRALNIWDELLARSSSGNDYGLLRGRTLILLGRYDEALRAAELMANRPDDGGESAYDVGCVLAFNLPLGSRDPLASARISIERAGAIADRAMKFLTLGAQRGQITIEQLQTDPDLESLRLRADFPRLLALVLDHGFPADAFAR